MIPRAVLAGSAVVASMTAVAMTAHAQVALYVTQTSASYEQVADDTMPTVPYAWAFYAVLYTTDVADSDSSVLTFAGPRSPFALPRVRADLPIFSDFSGYYATEAEIDADFPEGLYTFSVSGGTLGDQSGSLEVDKSVMTTTVPYFTGDTFSRLHAIDPFTDFAATIAPFDLPALATTGSITVSIYRTSGNRLLAFETTLSPGDTGFVIPADTLRNGRPYQVAMAYTTSRDLPGNFPGDQSTSSSAFARGIGFVIDVGCPGDYNGDGQVDFFDYLDFIADFSVEDQESDFNGDFQVDFFDYLDFIAALDRDC